MARMTEREYGGRGTGGGYRGYGWRATLRVPPGGDSGMGVAPASLARPARS